MQRSSTYLYIIIVLVICFEKNFAQQNSSALSQQSKSCVYLTSSEYLLKESSLVINSNNGDKFIRNFPKGLAKITVIKNDTNVNPNLIPFVYKKSKGKTFYRFNAGQIYGYCMNSECFRYYADSKDVMIKDGYHKIKSEGKLIIYAHRGGLPFYTVNYFYSLNNNSELKFFSRKNILSEFKDREDILKKILNDPTLSKNIRAKDQFGNFILNSVLEGFK